MTELAGEVETVEPKSCWGRPDEEIIRSAPNLFIPPPAASSGARFHLRNG